MANLLSQLTKDTQARFLEELNYLNLEEIRGFCSDRGIPYKILAEYPNGKMKSTKDIGRKAIVLARVRHCLATGDVGQLACLPAEYAYLTDLKHKRAGSEWKSLRKAKAESALQTLARIAPLPGQTSGRQSP